MDTKEKLWLLLEKIPRGKVITYGILARRLGIHPRAVGRLLSKNPEPEKIPCYKVVRSDGSLGGYSRGIKRKIFLLQRDGIEIKNGKVDLKKYCWKIPI